MSEAIMHTAIVDDISRLAMLTNARAAYLTDDTAAAATSAQWLRHWFLDPGTRMNPHLKHGQFIPGRESGRCFGIIDFSLYPPQVMHAAALLAELSDAPWTAADQSGMKAWCSQLLHWLQTDPMALEEEARPNNHGAFYDVLVVSLGLFTGQDDIVRSQLGRLPDRIIGQIAEDGSLTHEIKRTCSFGYSMMGLHGLVELADAAEEYDECALDWNGDAGQALIRGADFLYNHAASRQEWPHQQIEPIDWTMLVLLFETMERISGKAYPLEKLAHRFPDGYVTDTFYITEPIHPFGSHRTEQKG